VRPAGRRYNRRSVRILVITNDFPPRVGGIQTYVHEILSRLDDEVTVLASTSPGAAAFDATFRHRVIRVPTTVLLPTPRLEARVEAFVREAHPNVILFGAAMPLALVGASLRRRTGTPYATFTHGLEVSAARLVGGRALLRRIGRHAALVTAVSRWTADVLGPYLSADAPIELLPSGVDVDRFHPGVQDAAIRRRHALGASPVVACVSRLVRRKGQDTLIRALSAVARNIPNVRLLIVGDGPDRGRLWSLAQTLGVGHRVIFAGAVPDDELPMYFRAGDVFAMPCRSRWGGLEVEALGAVYLQAASVGRPVIAGRSGGTSDALVDGETGWLVDGRRVEAVAQAIAEILRAPDRGVGFGTRGAERIRRDFTWDQIAIRFRSLLGAAVTSS
jgi:phosphatidylinositol alpha-1,6-mannosyltransferase